jgi:hypothetical protein
MATNINFGEDTLIVSEDVAEVLRALEEKAGGYAVFTYCRKDTKQAIAPVWVNTTQVKFVNALR